VASIGGDGRIHGTIHVQIPVHNRLAELIYDAAAAVFDGDAAAAAAVAATVCELLKFCGNDPVLCNKYNVPLVKIDTETVYGALDKLLAPDSDESPNWAHRMAISGDRAHFVRTRLDLLTPMEHACSYMSHIMAMLGHLEDAVNARSTRRRGTDAGRRASVSLSRVLELEFPDLEEKELKTQLAEMRKGELSSTLTPIRSLLPELSENMAALRELCIRMYESLDELGLDAVVKTQELAVDVESAATWWGIFSRNT